MTDISLNASQRSALISLQETTRLTNRTTARLSTGRKVNSIADDAVSFFRSRQLNNRVDDLTARRQDISQGITTLQATLEATDAIDSLLKQLRGVTEGARTASQTERKDANYQFFNILDQISQVVEDASYQGLNLLNSTKNTLVIRFSERTSARLTISGFALNHTGVSQYGLFTNNGGLFTVTGRVADSSKWGAILYALGAKQASGVNNSVTFGVGVGGFTGIGFSNTNINLIDGLVNTIDHAITKNRAVAANLGNNAAILQTRLDFTTKYANRLKTGADDLVLADLNEEGSYLVALQTRTQLGVQSLQIAGSQQQSILQLIR